MRVDGSAIHRLPSVVGRGFETAIPLDPRGFLVQRTALNPEQLRGAGVVAAGLIQDAAKPVPQACISATVEYRGRVDVTDGFGKPDAENLFKVLQRYGAIAGDPGPLQKPLCEAVPVAAMEVGYAPVTGVLTYHKAPGDMVKKGEVVCEIIDPYAEDQTKARVPVQSLADGILFGRRPERIARPGMVIFRIASDKPLPHRLNRPALDD